MPKVDPKAPGLVLAPHLQYPTRDGADISLDRISRYLSQHLPYVDLVGMDTVTRFVNGEITHREVYQNRLRSPRTGAVRTLVFRSHYLLERFLTPSFRSVALSRLADERYGLVLFSYISTASLIAALEQPVDDRLLLVWTHNNQITWFQNLRRALSNPLLKLVAFLSERWYHRFFARHRGDFLYLYVTRKDFEGHLFHLGPHRGIVVPIGVDVISPPGESFCELEPTSQIRLLFVGSLNARMNFDALLHFEQTFLSRLQTEFYPRIEVVVAGRNPTADVTAICSRNGWLLRPNISDDDLEDLYASVSYAILPFPYSTGAKLKLLEALAHGVPFLATSHVGMKLEEVPQGCVVSDEPDSWILQIRAQPYPPVQIRKHLYEIAVAHDWQHVVKRLLRQLRDQESPQDRWSESVA